MIVPRTEFGKTVGRSGGQSGGQAVRETEPYPVNPSEARDLLDGHRTPYKKIPRFARDDRYGGRPLPLSFQIADGGQLGPHAVDLRDPRGLGVDSHPQVFR
jgi:hypothetical protein